MDDGLKRGEEQSPAVWMAMPYLSHSRSEVSWIRCVYWRILEGRRGTIGSLLLHFDGQEDFVLRVVSDELIGERAGMNYKNQGKAYMQPLRVEENTITGLLCEYC